MPETATAAIVKLAEEWQKLFVHQKRDNGDDYTSTQDAEGKTLPLTHPLQAAIFEAHDGKLPDDWTYKLAEEAVDAFADASDDADVDELRNTHGEAPIYNHERLQWLASHLDRVAEVDDAIEEYGVKVESILDAIAWGYNREAGRVFDCIANALEETAAAAAADDETDSDE